MPSLSASALRAAALACVLAVLLLAHVRIGEILSPAISRFPGTGDPTWRINATQTLQLARNWYRYGLEKNHFLPYFMRPRVEEPYPTSPYVSYPPGFVLLPWLTAKATGTPPELEHVAAWGRLFHFLCAALVSLIVWGLCLRAKAGLPISTALAAASGLLVLLTPVAAIYFPLAWWADAAGLPFFLALIALELFLPATTPWRRALHAVVITGGVLCDWLFFLLLGVVILRDLLAGPRRIRPELFALPAAYLALHTTLTWRAGLLDDLWAKLAMRAGIDRQDLNLASGLRSWWGGFETEAGATLAWLTVAALLLTPVLAVLRLRRREASGCLEAAFLLCTPALLHFVLLHQHYYDHPYESMKLVLLSSLFWLGIMPAFVLGRQRGRWQRALFTAALVGGAAALAYPYPALLRERVGRRIDLNPAAENFCRTVFRESDYPDIHFSPYLANSHPLGQGETDPRVHDWAYVACNGFVYLADRPGDVFDIYARGRWHGRLHGAPFRLLLWTRGAPGPEWAKVLVPGTSRAFGELRVQELSLSVLSGK